MLSPSLSSPDWMQTAWRGQFTRLGLNLKSRIYVGSSCWLGFRRKLGGVTVHQSPEKACCHGCVREVP